jgi:hypothetical protein
MPPDHKPWRPSPPYHSHLQFHEKEIIINMMLLDEMLHGQ